MSTLAASVVISVKNRAVLMWDCLAGLSRQSLGRERFEVVLIDNVSSEDLRAVATRAETELGLTIRPTYITLPSIPPRSPSAPAPSCRSPRARST